MRRAVLLVVMTVVILPALFLILFSFFSYYRYPLLIPEQPTLNYWADVLFRNAILSTGVKNSVLLGIFNGFFSTLFAFSFARAVTRHTFRGRRLAARIYSLPLFIPGITLFTGIHLITARLSLNNTVPGVVAAHMVVTIPYSASVIIAFLNGIAGSLEDSARTLGCGTAALFRRIILPLCAPALSLSFSMGFLISFGEYLSTFLIGGGRIISFATIMFPMLEHGDRGHASVLGIIFIALNVSMFFLMDAVAGRIAGRERVLFEP